MSASRDKLFRWADQIPEASWANLCSRPPKQAAEAVGAEWDGKTFKVAMLGVQYSIDPTNQKITILDQGDHRISYQAGVVLLTTLSLSKGVPPSGRMTVPQDLPGGRMFFTGAHAVAIDPLAQYFEKNSGQLLSRVLGIGGEIIRDAEIALRIPGLPHVPLYILFWRGDQEIPARAVIGIDDRAHFHLDLAGILALTNILVYEFCRLSEDNFTK